MYRMWCCVGLGAHTACTQILEGNESCDRFAMYCCVMLLVVVGCGGFFAVVVVVVVEVVFAVCRMMDGRFVAVIVFVVAVVKCRPLLLFSEWDFVVLGAGGSVKRLVVWEVLVGAGRRVVDGSGT